MKFVSNSKSSFSIEITPLIDIVFLLVIFFVVTSKVGDSQFLSLDLPESESFQSVPNQALNEISIISDGSVYINDKLININNTEELQDAIFLLKSNDIEIICVSEKAKKTIYETKLKNPLAIVMGSEKKGISNSVIKISDRSAKLPMKGNIDSLNVSVACATVLYEIIRQREFSNYKN